ncbi:MAG: ErfK/YbiS/YcfS/YnhG family protein [Herbaspirillum sp.]|jgi:murein L,D-transpeptidase YafK|nr:ErfK/YbiS/YcfS/YnhG family protein [Herbaspirillum sp.]
MKRNKLFLALLLSLSFHISSSRAADPVLATVAANNPETQLIDIYRDIGADRIAAAREKADALVAAYPHFRLGQLVRGDLLMMVANPIDSFGAAPNAPPDKMKDLRAEAMVRIHSLQQRPDPNLIPKAVLQVGADQKTVLLVDTKRSRLYVYANDGGKLRLQTDYYVSQGKLGTNKLREGDQKTPIGVYAVSGHIPGQKLPDFYGTGALPLNYPNEWDRRNKRGGSGIWLHGTPADNFSRPPLSSDGCIVLANPDIQSLYASTEVGKTTVLITDGVEFITKAAWNKEHKTFSDLIEEWSKDAENRDPGKLLANYSPRFRSGTGESLSTWFNRQQKTLNGVRGMTVKLSDVSLFLYPGEENVMVGTFTQETSVGKSKNITRKRQYWVKEDSGWKIVYEGTA